MIFNNCGKSLNNYLFRYGADESERFKSYKYLGLMTSPFGNFNLARQALKKAALKAFWSKKIKSLLEQIGLGDLWMKAHYFVLSLSTGQTCPEGRSTNRTQVLCEVLHPTLSRKPREIDHNTGNYVPYSFR